MRRPTTTPAERRARQQTARLEIAALRARLKQALLAKKDHMRAITVVLRSERFALRDRLRANRKRALEELRTAAREARANAREQWHRRRREAKDAATSDVARARAELAAVRAHQASQRQIERAERANARTHARTVKRAQTDDEVRALIPRELVPLFERVKASIRGRADETRAEAMLRYAERHPEETFKTVEPLGEQMIVRTRDDLAQATRTALRADAPATPGPKTDARQTRALVHRRSEGAEAASKEAIREAHEKLRKQRRALENQGARFERGEYGKLTRSEVWHRMAETGERLKLADEALASAENAFQTKYGHACWEVSA